ncbi:anosmin-1 [Lates japonicus]|uniref:Anosmin-1 n=1 Tax=Lates japonicus TaxID=270547 RepID=A0AAD3NBU8_LATJO|nr:anosmin-1 [Lates japonicus]
MLMVECWKSNTVRKPWELGNMAPHKAPELSSLQQNGAQVKKEECPSWFDPNANAPLALWGGKPFYQDGRLQHQDFQRFWLSENLTASFPIEGNITGNFLWRVSRVAPISESHRLPGHLGTNHHKPANSLPTASSPSPRSFLQ